MRGAFVACVGGAAAAAGDLERAAGSFRAHHGQLSFHHERGFAVAALGDSADGPEVAPAGGATVVTHGAPVAPFDELLRGRGRFAVVAWDGRAGRAARDPLGLAPLFYRPLDGCLWLATEVAPLLAIGPATPDLEGLAAAAAFVPPDAATGWRGVHRVLPGHALEIRPDGAALSTRYWDPALILDSYRGGRAGAVTQFATRLQSAADACRAPTTGVLLSGGIDSASVALAAGRCGRPLHLVHVRFPEELGTDEEPYAREVADALGAPLHCVPAELGPWDPHADLERLGIPYQRFPFGHQESALAHLAAHGVPVALDGHDGDGLLGYAAGEWGALVTTGQFRRAAALAREQGAVTVARRIAADLVPPWARPVRRRTPFLQGFERYFDRVLARPMRETDVHRWRPPKARWRLTQLLPVSPRATVSFEWNELQAASFGVDIRHPFAQRDVLELLLSLPMAIKSEPGRTKGILRDALADWLPPSVRARPKTDHSRALDRRVDKSRCLEWIRASGARLPHLNYDQLYRDADSGLDDLSVFLLVNLARLHVFAAETAPSSGTRMA